MLVRAEKLKLRFQAYCDNWRPENRSGNDGDTGYNVWEDKLSPEEWDGVREVIKVLAPFRKATKKIERRDSSLQDYVPYCDIILDHLRKASQHFQRQADHNSSEAYQWLHICTESALDKANDLFKKIDDSPAYYTARVVDPKFKFEWFERRWSTDHEKLERLKYSVTHHWETHYRSCHAQDSSSISISEQLQQIELGSDSDSNDNDDSLLDLSTYISASYTDTSSQEIDEFTEYVSSAPRNAFELTEWQFVEQKHPDLVRFALDHAAIPISSSECERSFSSAKLTLNPLRAKMKSDLFEALETLRAWYLAEEGQKKQEMDRTEQKVISEALDREGA